MKMFIQGELSDIYYVEPEYNGQKYPGYQVEFFNPDGQNQKTRRPTIKVSIDIIKLAKLDNQDQLKSVRGKQVQIEGTPQTTPEGRLTLQPKTIRVI
jgi:hypothetical protein